MATLSPGVGSLNGGLAYVNGELIAAAYSTSTTAYRINPSTGASIATLSLGGTGYLNGLGGDGVLENSSSFVGDDPAQESPPIGEQTPLSATSTYGRLFALRTNGTTATIYELNPLTGAVIRSFTAPGTVSTTSLYLGLAAGPTSLFYVYGYGASPHILYELNPDTGAVIDSDIIDPVSPSPIGGLGYLNGKVYIEQTATNNILVWDPVSDKVVKTLIVSADLNGGLTGAGNLNVLFDSNATSIFKIDPDTGAVLATLTPGTGSFTGGLAYINGELIAAPNSTSATAYRIDPSTGVVIGTMSLGGTGYLTGLGGDGALPLGVHVVAVNWGDVVPNMNFGNHQLVPAEIRGSKWNDLDGDGVWDAGEPALAGATVYLDANNNGVLDAGEISTTTAADGSYAFTGLAPGNYTVAEVVPTGWKQTYPSTTTIADRLFALRSATTGTSAMIYELNPTTGAVIRSFAAPGIVTSLSAYQGLALGPAGLFYIDGYGSTTHTLWELNPDTGAVIDSDIIDAVLPSPIAGLGYLKGKVYIEQSSTNKILVWDPVSDTLVTTLTVSADLYGGLTGAADLNVLFDSNSPGQIFKIDPSTGAVLATLTPGIGGLYGGLAYVNGELIASNYSTSATGYRINPSTGAVIGTLSLGGTGYLTGLGGDGMPDYVHVVTVNYGDVVWDKKFGDQKIPPAEIHGSVWKDLDGDGTWDPGEPTLAGWTIFLDTDQDGVLDPGEISTTSLSDGSYAFVNMPPGTYTVAQVPQTGWTQTYPLIGSGTLYFSADGTAMGLYSLNTATGAATLLGASGVTGSTVGLAPALPPESSTGRSGVHCSLSTPMEAAIPTWAASATKVWLLIREQAHCMAS